MHCRLVVAVLVTSVTCTDLAVAQNADADHVALARKQIADEMARYTVQLVEGNARLERVAESILRWSNPVLGDVHGDVFLWTHHKRPVVVASAFWQGNLGIEFQTLTDAKVAVEWNGEQVWSPVASDVAPRLVPGAPSPVATSAGRLFQMRTIARRFGAKVVDRNDDTIVRPLRILPKPAYRYASPESDVVDGAVFLFVEGTDPEIIMLLEARGVNADDAKWHFVLGRQNSIAMRVTYDGADVWNVPKLAPPWSNVRSPGAEYILFNRTLTE